MLLYYNVYFHTSLINQIYSLQYFFIGSYHLFLHYVMMMNLALNHKNIKLIEF
jgi:hypothetical protein